MKVQLFKFQEHAIYGDDDKRPVGLRQFVKEAIGTYERLHTPQIISFTAPTGAGKTIIMSSLIEDIYCGDYLYEEQPDAIFVWLSDSPQLNEQSRDKIDTKADRIRLGQCVMVSDDSFDQETFDDGHIYFLNTQKLSKSSNLTKHTDSRTYTIWETLANTVEQKSDRFYVIIDEAHRGMQGKDASRATSIMQKFIKGSPEDDLPPMPVVIGMSATMARFNKLVAGTSSTVYSYAVTAKEVKDSGLLKDRIIITYPEAGTHNEMAVLQAAADNWKDKWDRWDDYCREQHYSYVNPIFVIQVAAGKGDHISETDLDECLRIIEERTGFKFTVGEVVHTFGDTTSAITIDGLDIQYEEPSRIADDKNIKVVFFKENLSTGWDCPRAETMMSFCTRQDATYIAQLLGRMVRTPMQMHIQVDDTLNDVHLYLPFFDRENVQKVVDELQSSEGGDIPTEVDEESFDKRKYDTVTVKPAKHVYHEEKQVKGQESFAFTEGEPSVEYATEHDSNYDSPETELVEDSRNNNHKFFNLKDDKQEEPDSSVKNDISETTDNVFNRDEVVEFINHLALPTYHIRNVRRSKSYLTSLFDLVHVLTQSGLYQTADRDVNNDIVEMIHRFIESLQTDGAYDELASKITEFKLQEQIFDIFGESANDDTVYDIMSSTDTDIDRQFNLAENRLGRNGVGNAYGNQYGNNQNPNRYKIDVIIYASDENCLKNLNEYAEKKFHELHDEYRLKIPSLSEKYRKKFNDIVTDGDAVSELNFQLPDTLSIPHDSNGEKYSDHLFVDADTGTVQIKLNPWESGVLKEEEQKDDFVCWIRNFSKAPWALTVKYQYGAVTKPAYPDLLVIRWNKDIPGYVIDILEPHMPSLDDNLEKAKGFAEYALTCEKQGIVLGHIEIIREMKKPSGQPGFCRLDMAKSETRKKVLNVTTKDELNKLFETDGFFDS